MSTRTIALTLAPTDAQAAAFARLRCAFVDACTHVSATACETQTFNSVRLHHLVYNDVRARYGLMAQHAVRVIGVVAASYRAARNVPHTFRRDGAVVLDTPRLYRLEGNHAALTTLEGRVRVKLNSGGIPRDALKRAVRLGEAALICDRTGRWRLMVSAHDAATPLVQTAGVMGVDRGRTDSAVTSDGDALSGQQVTAGRDRDARTPQMIQTNVSTGTRSSRRRGRAVPARLAGRERRFQGHTNHVVSRRIVHSAAQRARAISIEELTSIRARTNTQPRSKTQRRRSTSWAFFPLRLFLAYKCEDAGIPLVRVTPRSTCQMCSCCLWMGERSGKSFHCVNPSCRWSGDADENGAHNIALLGAVVMQPCGPYPSCALVQEGRRASQSCLL